MQSLILNRLRPRAGWVVALLALGAAGAPALAARDADLRLPADLVLWAGLGGALIGMRLARPLGAVWRALYALIILTFGAALVVAAGRAMPPTAMLRQDLAALLGFLVAWPERPSPDLLSGRFLALALPRLREALVAAPSAGEAGAALLVASGAILSTLAGALTLGYGAARRRDGLGWGVPLLSALTLTSVLGGSAGGGLVSGLGALLALTLVSAQQRREQRWDAEDYASPSPDMIRPAIYGWGLATALVPVVVALALPTGWPLNSPLPAAELPSGLAAIEGHIQRPAPPLVDPGLSQLSGVFLGRSLERDAPDTVSLRVRLNAPLAPAPWPRYWRARVLNVYTGRAWTSNARREPFGPPLSPGADVAGMIVQEIEDLRADPASLVALPELIALDIAASAERLPDGSLAAITSEQPPTRYHAISRPQSLDAPPGTRPEAPPDYADSLAVPPRVPRRVGDLARAIAGEAGAPYAQALALEAYLRSLPYSYEVRPLPADGDAVDQFLFSMGHGYCTYYASAMAIMARSLGIPARLAVGYATGDYDQASGVYTIYERDAHAWPELLIDGRWLPFEPTPALALPARNAPNPAPLTPETAPTPEIAPAPAWALWLALALAGAGVALGSGLLWQARRSSPLWRAQRGIERGGTRAGVTWPQGATLHEYALLLEARAGSPGPALREAVGLIERARYGRRPLSLDEARQLSRASGALAAWLRRAPLPTPREDPREQVVEGQEERQAQQQQRPPGHRHPDHDAQARPEEPEHRPQGGQRDQ